MRNTFLLLFAAACFAGCNHAGNDTQAGGQPGESATNPIVLHGLYSQPADPATDATDENRQLTGSLAVSVVRTFDLSRAKLQRVKFPEVHLPNITVTEDSTYSVYAVNDDVLFDTDKATIKPAAAATLNEIANSIGTRFASRDVEVMGFADSRGEASYNKQLGQERANAVQAYLVKNSKLTKNNVETESFGEQQPVAINATPAGRQQNRRVEIAVRKR